MKDSQVCGVIASPIDVRDYTIKPIDEFPERFELKPPEVQNQGTQSTCVAHAASSVVEYHFNRQHGFKEKFSTEFIYGYRDEGYYVGDGMVIRDALKTLQKIGDVYEKDCRGNHGYEKAMSNVRANLDNLIQLAYAHRISSYVRLHSPEEIKTALMTIGPVLISMNWYSKSYLKNNIYTWNETDDYGRHCVMIYGWNKNGWLVQNSWGALWGADGKFTLPYNFKINESWGIVDDIKDSELVEIITPKDDKISKLLYKVANFIIKLADIIVKRLNLRRLLQCRLFCA